MIIGITGYAGVGKDSFAMALEPHGYRRRSFADPLKAIAEEMYPWVRILNRVLGRERAKRWCPPVRRAYQRLGTAVREHLSRDVWAEHLLRDTPPNTVIADVRYANEAELITRHRGIIVKINRPGYGPVNGHHSETLEGIVPTYVVNNDGTLRDLSIYAHLFHDLVSRLHG